MVLKKQTVWLLTMLSLVIVLSVYYITSPGQSSEYAVVEEESKQGEENAVTTEQNGVEVKVEEMSDGTATSSVSSDQMFTALRMEIEDHRNALREQLQAVVASTNVTAEKRSEALDKMEELQTVSTKESILETMIKAKEIYKDALVRTDGNEVRVIVKATEHSPKAANELIQMVRNEMGEKHVAVEFQPVK